MPRDEILGRTALDTYLLKVKYGLPGVRFGQYFPILNTERIPNEESDANQIEDFYRNKNIQIPRSEKTHIQALCKDAAYQEYYKRNFGTKCGIISQRVEEFNDLILAETLPNPLNESGESSD